MDEVLTIDELTAKTGVPSRTIRQYQTDGLLARPAKRGRVGAYDQSHVERLVAIGRLQERGYSLAGMRDLFEAWEQGGALDNVVGIRGTQPDAAVDEAPVLLDDAQLHAAFPALTKPAVRRAAVAAGLIATGGKRGEGWIVRSESALSTLADLVAAGATPAAAIAVYATLRSTLREFGNAVASTIARIDNESDRTALLRRNRAPLGRIAATLVIEAVGAALGPADLTSARVGAVRDRRDAS